MVSVLGKCSRRTDGRANRRRLRRRYKGAMVALRRTRMPRQPVLNVTRQWWALNWSPSSGSIGGFWQYLSTSVGSIPNIGEYTALFDSYKVNSFTIILRPRYNSFAGNDTTDTTLPGVTNQGGNDVHVIIDPKSTVVPSGLYTSTNLNTFLENGKVRSYRGMNPITIMVKYPCMSDDVNNTANSDFKRFSYVSTTNTGVSIRGAHVFISDVNLTGIFGQSYDVFYRLNVTFRGMK